MPAYDFKQIPPILPSKELIDAILYKTMRKTPTIVRKQFNIARIRNFYMLKVKFTYNTIDSKVDDIVNNFPKLEQIHPFYRYWFNVLYDRDHFKIALGQLKQCKLLVDKVSQHYIKLLKHADSLFYCKQLKISALGRMVSMLRKMDPYLRYLEQVRQHMGRLPNIDPAMRSVVIAGYPSAGKSSFLNSLTSANVDVQAYAFTTYSLLLGHTERAGITFQLIDTPGLLDRNLEERNNIELYAITALAYLNSVIIFVLDVTYGAIFVEKYVSLFNSLRPFFANKNVVIALSKCDLWTPESLSQEELQLIQSLSPFSFTDTVSIAKVPYISGDAFKAAMQQGGLQAVQAMQAQKQENERIAHIIQYNTIPILAFSSLTANNNERVFNVAADILLRSREKQNVQTYGQGQLAIPGLFVAYPKGKTAAAQIPSSVQELNNNLLNPRPLGADDGFLTELDKEREFQTAKYNFDAREKWDLHNPQWVNDPIPLIHNGKNILDFITVDEDILALVQQLEEEETRISQQPDQYNDEELFKRFDALKRLTHFARPKNAKVNELRAKVLEKKAIAKRDVSSVGKPRVCAISKQRSERVDADERYRGITNPDDLKKAKKIFGKLKRSDAKQQNTYSEMPRHLAGKMSNQTRDWR